MAVPTQHQHASHKKCTSASCSSRSKIWKAIQLAIATDDRKGLAAMFQDQDRIVHFKTVLLKERNINDASALPPSHKHQILQFDKPIRPEAFTKFGNSVTDLNALQVALFRQREGIACQLLQFLRQNATPSELQAFIGHVWGKGNSSLHLACFHGMPRLVQMLLDMGADPNATNARDLTPADCCKDPGCLAALKKIAADSPELLPPVIGRRASATLPPQPTRVAAVPLRRQASVPGLKLAKPVSEKKPTPALAPKSPTKRSMLPPPAKAPAKSDAATASLLHGNKARNQGNVKPTLAKRQSSGLKPTPETERLVTKAPADPSAAALQQQQQQQQQQHQQKQQQKQAATAPTVTADPIKERRLQIPARLPQQPSDHDASPPLLPSTDGVPTVDDAPPPPPTEATPLPHPTPSSLSPALGLHAGGKQPFNHPPNISDGLQPPSSALTSAVKHANDGPPLKMSTAKAQEDSPGNIATTTTTTTTTVPEASHDTTRGGQSTLEPDDPSGAAAQTDLALAIQHLVSVFTVKGILEQSTKQWTAMALSRDAADAHRQYASHQSCSAGVMHSLTGDSQVARGQIAVL